MTAQWRTRKKYGVGFTLAEILVVVSIIAIMTTVVLVSVRHANEKARAARQRADLKLAALALQSYYIDKSSYPSTGGVWYSSETGDGAPNNGGAYIPGLAPAYMPALPRSRGGPTLCAGWKNAYLYKSDGANYKLIMNCGPDGTWTSADEYYDPVRPTSAWAVCSNTATCAAW